MKFSVALEAIHQLAKEGQRDESLMDVISSDIDEEASEQRYFVEMFREFTREHHRMIYDEFGGLIERLEATRPEDFTNLSLYKVQSVDAGPLGYMMAVSLDLACQCTDDIDDPASHARAMTAIRMVSQFWVEAGRDFALQVSGAPAKTVKYEDDMMPGF